MRKLPVNNFIEEKLYKKIIDNVPIVVIDVILTNRGQFLLGKRKNKPLKGAWCLPGGRLFKGELLKNGAQRKVKEVTGLKIKKPSLLTIKEFFLTSAQGPVTHQIDFIFTSETKGKSAINDGQHAQLRWFSKIEKHWPKYVRDALELAGFHH